MAAEYKSSGFTVLISLQSRKHSIRHFHNIEGPATCRGSEEAASAFAGGHCSSGCSGSMHEVPVLRLTAAGSGLYVECTRVCFPPHENCMTNPPSGVMNSELFAFNEHFLNG